MKFIELLSLAPAVTALVLPDQQVIQNFASHADDAYSHAAHSAGSFVDSVRAGLDDLVHGVKESAVSVEDRAKSALDQALHFYSTTGQSMTEEVFDSHGWAQATLDNIAEAEDNLARLDKHIHCSISRAQDLDEPPHRRPEEPPHHRPEKPPHHHPERPPHHDPHHGHRHPNLTVYQLIAESKYTTKLAKLINDFPDLVEALNGTKANYTVFAPTDKAFAKIPEHAPKPSKEQLKKLLSYHVSPDFYPASRVALGHTIPTLFLSEELAEKPVPQRLSFHISLHGLTVNFYSRIVAVNIFGTNGVIHGVDSLILPPPRILKIIDLLPSEFSTLELALTKTGLIDELNEEPEKHPGGTLFAPSNFAFSKLGPRLNAFLFSKYGQKYLKALLKYHIVPKTTFYSDAIYGYDGGDDGKAATDPVHNPLTHLELPTALGDSSINVDIARWHGFQSIRLNGFVRIVITDGIAKDGVIQVTSDVLIPPKRPEGAALGVEGELTIDDLKERLEPFLE